MELRLQLPLLIWALIWFVTSNPAVGYNFTGLVQELPTPLVAAYVSSCELSECPTLSPHQSLFPSLSLSVPLSLSFFQSAIEGLIKS